MLTGLRACDMYRPLLQHNLVDCDTYRPLLQHNPVDWVKPYLADQRKLATVIDSRLEGRYPEEAALRIAHLAQRCLEDIPGTRPSMKQVVETLEDESNITGNWQISAGSDKRVDQPQTGIDDVEIRTTATNESTSQDESNITGNWQISAGSDTDMPNLRKFSFSKLKEATKNFRIDNLLGEGRFGIVYKGWLDAKVTSKNGSGIVVAIKRMDYRHEHSVGPLCGLSHSNFVNILGYCWEDPKLFLVYEFMQNGSLEQHLFRRGSAIQPLPWDIRLKILIGAAQGLAFLHALETPVICKEFKASNILLDESFNSKISDFSYGDLDSPEKSCEYVPKRYPGAHPVYEAPEYVRKGPVSVKSDVYSFGVVLLEMLTGLCAHDMNSQHWQRNLVDWVKPYLDDSRRKLARVIDVRLEGRYPMKAALRIAQLAQHCLEDIPGTRPSMKQVVETLESISASHGNTE